MRRRLLPTLSLLFLGLALACSGTEEDEQETLSPPEAALTVERAPQGSWSFDEECGETAGGTPIFVHYTISVSGEEVSVAADGYQTMLRVVGAVTAHSTRRGEWTVRFVRQADEDGFGGAYLEADDVMFTFAAEGDDLRVNPAELIFNCTEEPALFAKGS